MIAPQERTLKRQRSVVPRKHKKFLLPIPIIISVLLLSSSFVHSQPYQCDVDGDGKLGLAEVVNLLQEISGLLAGERTTPIDCGSPVGSITNPDVLGVRAKQYLLCQHNEIRSRTALGLTDAYGGGKHPAATNMRRLQWDENLATVASNWAAQCIWAHNGNRTSEYRALLTGDVSGVSVGENIYASTVDPTVFSTSGGGSDYGIAGAVFSWNSESTDWVYGSTRSSSTCYGNACGHFTQNVWAQTTRVGCGYYNCSQGLTGEDVGEFKTFVVCNYAQAGNSPASVYRSGQSLEDVCTEEDSAGDTCENGLLTPANYTTGLDYECDVDGDSLLGLEELIYGLHIVSGQTP